MATTARKPTRTGVKENGRLGERPERLGNDKAGPKIGRNGAGGNSAIELPEHVLAGCVWHPLRPAMAERRRQAFEALSPEEKRILEYGALLDVGYDALPVPRRWHDTVKGLKRRGLVHLWRGAPFSLHPCDWTITLTHKARLLVASTGAEVAW